MRACLARSDDDEKDTYLHISAEKKYGGHGAKAEGLKFFGWGQWDSRLLDNTNDATANLVKYDRNRAGLGVKCMKKPYRFTAEYITADGMIFVGPDKPSFTFATTNGTNAKAKGWYLEGGWYIPKTKWELDLRYDTMTRLEGRADEHQFDKWTLGVQYHFNPKTRVTLNYEMRDFACTGSVGAPCTNVNGNLRGVDDKVGVQLTAIF